MATQRQKKLARAIVTNLKEKEPKNAMQLLISAGYDEITARASSTRTIEQQGVQDELIKMGFTEVNAKETVVKIMENRWVQPSDRLKAADMIFKVQGSYAPEKSVSMQVRGDVKDFAKYQQLSEKYEQELLNTYQNE